MRVTHFISSLDTRGGGPSVALEGLTAEQLQQGLDVRVVVTVREEHALERIERMRERGVAMTPVGPARGPFANHPDLREKVDAAIADTDVAHLHGMWEQIHHDAARSAKAQATPYLIRPCGMLDPWSLSQSRLKKKLALAWRVRRNLNQAAGLQFTTNAERDLAGPLHLRARPYVVPNGVPQEVLEADVHQGPAPAGPPQIIFLSRLHPKKGVDLLIQAIAALKERPASPLQQATLALAGPDEGAYRAELEKLVESTGVSDRCTFTGLLEGEAKRKLLRDGDLFCLPSHQENFGIVVVESLACGLPVVISPHVNIIDEVENAQVGLRCPMTPPGIADALEAAWLAFPRPNRAAFRERSRRWVTGRYSWQAVAHQLQTIYETTLSPVTH